MPQTVATQGSPQLGSFAGSGYWQRSPHGPGVPPSSSGVPESGRLPPSGLPPSGGGVPPSPVLSAQNPRIEQFPEQHSAPVAQAAFLLLQVATQPPFTQASVAVQTSQAAPFLPQAAAALPGWQMEAESRHPVMQEDVVSRQTPFTLHALPFSQA